MADDNIQNALDELEEVEGYKNRYLGSASFEFDHTQGRLVRAIRYLAAEVESLRDQLDER